MIYAFMYLHSAEFSIARMAKVLEVSGSGYYKWYTRQHQEASPKEIEDAALTAEILRIFRESRGSFGYRKITAILNKGRKEPVNHKRVARIMREYGLRSRTVKTYACTTDSDHDYPIAENLIQRDFTAAGKNEKMVSDTTVISTGEGNLYVAGILDLYGRMPVGFAMSIHNDRFLVMEALEDMLIRGCGKQGCILHSDRGSTYASDDYRKLLEENQLVCSMSRKGNCWDNAPMECFWGKMKSEWMDREYETIAEAAADVYEYCWSFYPHQRIHASLNYMTPVTYYDSWTGQLANSSI